MLWMRLVPKEGRAASVQGELIRCVGRLADELYRNGNHNWGPMFREMIVFLRAALVFTDEVRNRRVQEDVDRLTSFGENPRSVQYQEAEDEIDRLTEAVLRFCKEHPDLIARAGATDVVQGSIADLVADVAF